MTNLVGKDLQAANRNNRTTTTGSAHNQPPGETEALIRGVTHTIPCNDQSPRTRHCIDWLTYTVPMDVGIHNAFLPHQELSLMGEVLSNHKGYDTTLALTHGNLSFHTCYPQHKICVSFSGAALSRLVARNVPLIDLLGYALELGGKITRLDFALDYFGPSSPKDLYDAWKQRALRTLAREVTRVQNDKHTKAGDTEAHTTYIGSRSSERFLCCYDKAAQTRSTDLWTRLELHSNRSWGQRLGNAMLEHGVANAGKQAVRDFVRCDIPWFVEATSGPSVYIPPIEEPESHRKDWLLETILPLLCQEVEAGASLGDYEVRDAYLAALTPSWQMLRRVS